MRTGFNHRIDGFAFVNSWEMTGDDWGQLRNLIGGAVTALTWHPLVLPLVGLVPPHLPPFSNLILGEIITSAIVANAGVGSFGLCGGMTFAAADYHRLSLLPQRGESGTSPRAPGWSTPVEAGLRRHIWNRQLDSLRDDGALKTLLWMAVCNDVWPFKELGGMRWLRDQSRAEFAVIRSHLDRGTPWPIFIIGTTDNPFNNHQVLVTGYEVPSPTFGGDSCCLYVYEPNVPNRESRIDFDFAGVRRTIESAYAGGFDSRRGPLQGFFGATYRPLPPPPAVQVTSGLSVTPSERVAIASRATFTMQVRNVGWGATPPLRLHVAGRAGTRNVDAGGETVPQSLAMGATRAASVTQTLGPPAGPRHYFASSLVDVDGQRTWRLLAAAPGARERADLEATLTSGVTGPADTVTLSQFFSSARTDNCAVASAAGRRDVAAAGYALSRAEAYIHPTQRPDTVPLDLYWSAARGDNFTTATDAGRADAAAAGYVRVRTEGYVARTQQLLTVPLRSYWNERQRDNFTTASDYWRHNAAVAGYRPVRIEGYAFPRAVGLMAHGGQFLGAEGGGGSTVDAKRASVGPHETFEVIYLSDGRIALRTALGYYLCAEGGGGREVVANRTWIGGWERFQPVHRGAGRLALRVPSGQFISAVAGGGQEVVASRDVADAWETLGWIGA